MKPTLTSTVKPTLALLALTLLAPLAALHAAEPPAASFTITDLRCGGQVEPLGIDDEELLLGWQIKGDRRGLRQTACRVLAASSPDLLADGKADLWDSGKIESDQSQWVKYSGKAPASAQRVYWRVEVWDGAGRKAVSKPSWFESGLLDPADWTAEWVESDPPALSNETVDLWANFIACVPKPFIQPQVPEWETFKREAIGKVIRSSAVLHKTFDLDRVPDAVRLYAASVGFYEVYLNGHRVGDAEFESTFGLHRVAPLYHVNAPPLYRVYDVANLLKTGRNEIRVKLARGRKGIEKHPNGYLTIEDAPQFILQVDAIQNGARRTLAATDASWKQAPGALLKESFALGEIFDGRRDELRRDLSPDDPAWKPVSLLDPKAKDAPQPLKALRWNFNPPERVVRKVKAVDVFSPAEGIWVFDLGELISGTFAWTEPEGMAAGDAVVFRQAIMLNRDGGTSTQFPWYPEGTKASVTDSARMIWRNDSYGTTGAEPISEFKKLHPEVTNAIFRAIHPTLIYLCTGKAGRSWRTSAMTHAFRYVEVVGLKKKPKAEDLTGLFIFSDVERIGGFECANPALNAWDERCRRAQLINTHGFLSDCWDREKSPWGADGISVAPSSYYFHEITGPIRKMASDSANSTRVNKQPPGVSSLAGWGLKATPPMVMPSWHKGTEKVPLVSPMWESMLIKLPWFQYLYRGDSRSARECFGAMMTFLRFYFPSNTEGPIYHEHMCDWLTYAQTYGQARQEYGGYHQRVMETALFYDIAGQAAVFAEMLNRHDEVAWLKTLQQTMRSLLMDKYWNKEKQTFGDDPKGIFNKYGTDSEDGWVGGCHAVSEEVRKILADGIARQIRERGHTINGYITFPLMLDLLADFDHADTVYAWFDGEKPHGIKAWMAAVPDGMPEWIYRKQPEQMGSFSHISFAPMNRWFYYGLGGLRPDAKNPGFKHLSLVPQVPRDLDHASIWHQSPYGRIESAWKKENGKLVWNVTVPPNTTATVSIPASSAETVTESGKPLAKSEGVKFTKIENGRALCELQSGTYRFESQLEKKQR